MVGARAIVAMFGDAPCVGSGSGRMTGAEPGRVAGTGEIRADAKRCRSGVFAGLVCGAANVRAVKSDVVGGPAVTDMAGDVCGCFLAVAGALEPDGDRTLPGGFALDAGTARGKILSCVI